jgi:NADH:ubiquinone oxidoreductase subunit 2 (subunit N)
VNEDQSAEVLALPPELILLLGAVGGLLLGLWTPQRRQGRVRAVAVVVCLASAVAAAVALPDPAMAVFEGTWTIDSTTGCASWRACQRGPSSTTSSARTSRDSPVTRRSATAAALARVLDTPRP